MPLSQKWYKAKQQHVSKAQKRSISTLWPKYGIDLKYNHSIDYNELWPVENEEEEDKMRGEKKHVSLDIGFGKGDSIIYSAIKSTVDDKTTCKNTRYFLGCEIHRAGIANTLQRIADTGLENVRIIRSDVILLLEQNLKDESLQEVSIYFPDPWPNAERDGDRRVVRPYTLSLLSNKLENGGILRIATDVEEYAEHVKASISHHNAISTSNKFNLFQELKHLPCENVPSYRPITTYERKAADTNNEL